MGLCVLSCHQCKFAMQMYQGCIALVIIRGATMCVCSSCFTLFPVLMLN